MEKLFLVVAVVAVVMILMAKLGAFIKNHRGEIEAEVDNVYNNMKTSKGYFGFAVFTIMLYIIALMFSLLLYIELYVTKGIPFEIENVYVAEGIKALIKNLPIILPFVHQLYIVIRIKWTKDETKLANWMLNCPFLVLTDDEVTFLTYISSVAMGMFALTLENTQRDAILAYLIINVLTLNGLKLLIGNLTKGYEGKKEDRKKFILFRISTIVALFGIGFLMLFGLVMINASPIILTAATFGILFGIVIACIMETYGENETKEVAKKLVNKAKNFAIQRIEKAIALGKKTMLIVKNVINKGKKQFAIVSIAFMLTMYAWFA